MNTIKKIVILTAFCASLSACELFDTDNTPPPAPLASFTTEIKVQNLWTTRTGYGVGNDYLKLAPALSYDTIYTANKDGTLTATDKKTGKNKWQAFAGGKISASPAVDGDMVFVGTRDGNAVGLTTSNGAILWKTPVTTEVLAAPAVNNRLAIIKTLDGKVTALDRNDGHHLWDYQEAEPTLILRGSSAPKLVGSTGVVGFANGALVKLSLQNGDVLWKQNIASPEGMFPIQRMVDIDTDPVVRGNTVFAASYQGKVAALSYSSGNISWAENLSSYNGIAVDDNQVYVSDARSYVTAYNAETGAIAWRQMKLYARNISGPAVIGNYIVVGDEQGYLHWINKQDGHFVARVKMSHSAILAAPVVENNVLYVVTRDGVLAAYTYS